MGTILEKNTLELIELIYTAGLDPSKWPDFLSRLADIIPHGAIAFQSIDLQKRSPSICQIENWQDGALDAYVGHYAHVSPWVRAHASARIGVPYYSDDMCPSSSYAETEFFADFVKPYQVHCGAVAIKLFDEAGLATALGVNYDERLGSKASEPIGRLLSQLAPHLQRALLINRALGQQELHSRTVESILATFQRPALVVTHQGVLVHMNEPAANAIRRQRGIALSKTGQLMVGHRDTTAMAHKLIDQAGSCDQLARDQSSGFVAFPVDGEPGPNVAFIAPLATAPSSSIADVLSSIGAHVLVTILYRQDHLNISEDAMVQLFALTHAESQVVIALTRSKSLFDIARETGRSINTVRLHLKRAMAKANCHTQSELVAIALQLQTSHA